MPQTSPPSNKLLTETEAAQRLGVSPITLRVWRHTGRGTIPFVRLGKRSIRYRAEDIERFIEASRVDPAAEVA